MTLPFADDVIAPPFEKASATEECVPRKQKLTSYGGEVAHAEVYSPRSVEQLRTILREVRDRGARVTFRGGGCAFDSQALSDDVVVSLAAMDAIEIDPAAGTVTAGPGATWGSVLEAALRHGLIPYVLVTTRDATVGGTASADCLSRFSPSCGKEGWHVLSFELLTVDGALLRCSRDENADVFFAAIGGLGYLGAITRATYRLLRVGHVPRVATEVIPYRSIREVITALASSTVPHREAPGPDMEASYGAWFGERALLFRSRYVEPTRRRKPLPLLHQPSSPLRALTDIILRNQALNRIVWFLTFHVVARKARSYVDGLEDYTFFMDGNSRAKSVGRAFGAPMRSLQQTFLVPADLPAPDDASLARSVDVVTRFIEELAADLRARGVLPTLFDCLFIPRDEAFLLSSSAQRGGFAVSVAFDTSNPRLLAAARAALVAASRRCGEIGGRVHLVKHVCADPEDLSAMYGEGAKAFFALKRRLDPTGVLRNEFLERTFPAYV